MKSEIAMFCSTIKARSKENNEAFDSMIADGKYGIAVGIIRQEVDSLIRAAYIDCLGVNSVEAENLFQQFVADEKWYHITPEGKRHTITDKEMVELHGGWVSTAYSFGCQLIHLSTYHAYGDTDPFQKMDNQQKTEIINYLKQYHQYKSSDISMSQLIPYLPKIMQKITENCMSYIRSIEREAK